MTTDTIPATFLVVCPDGRVRHEHGFTTRREADLFAEWGHACTRSHRIVRGTRPLRDLADETLMANAITWTHPATAVYDALREVFPAETCDDLIAEYLS